MKSILPTPEDRKREEKLMRKIRAVDNDPSAPPPTLKQQKKSAKAFRRIIKDSLDNDSIEKH